MLGFEERMRNGQGHYLDEAKIDARRAIRFTDLLRNTPGLRVLSGRYGNNEVLATRINGIGGDCTPVVFLDGIQANSAGGGAADQGLALDDILQPGDVAGVEVYTGLAGVPPRFQVSNSCGTILVWTRQGRKRAPARAP
jgi:hypothetical protein